MIETEALKAIIEEQNKEIARKNKLLEQAKGVLGIGGDKTTIDFMIHMINEELGDDLDTTTLPT